MPMPSSLAANVVRAHDVAPARNLGAQVFAEFFGTGAHRLDAELNKSLACLGQPDNTHELAVKSAHDSCRRARGRENAEPRLEGIVGQPRLRERRPGGQRGKAQSAPDPE